MKGLLLFGLTILGTMALFGALDSFRLVRRWGFIYHAFFTAGIGTAIMMYVLARVIYPIQRIEVGDPYVTLFTVGLVLTLEGWLMFGVLVWMWRRGRRQAP